MTIGIGGHKESHLRGRWGTMIHFALGRPLCEIYCTYWGNCALDYQSNYLSLMKRKILALSMLLVGKFCVLKRDVKRIILPHLWGKMIPYVRYVDPLKCNAKLQESTTIHGFNFSTLKRLLTHVRF